MSTFAFLHAGWPLLHESAARAERKHRALSSGL